MHVPEGRRIFTTLTVHENLQLGGYLVRDQAEIGATDRARSTSCCPGWRSGAPSRAARCPAASSRCSPSAARWSAGPRLLMLDEPSMGLAPLVVALGHGADRGINAEGTSVLLVEQNARAALGIAHRALRDRERRVRAAGPAAELPRDPRVVEAYLGA